MRYIAIALSLFIAVCSSAFGQSYPSPVAKTPSALLNEFQSCTAQSASPGCITPNRVGDVVDTFAGRTPVSVTDYGAACDGSTNDTTAFSNAATAAGTNGILWIPSGKTCKITNLTAQVNIYSSPGWGTIQAISDTGAGTALLNLNGGFVENIALVGPNGDGYPGVDTAPAQMYGLENYSTASSCAQPLWRSVWVAGFYAGFVINCNYGHELLEDNIATNNFYGLYVLNSGQDIRAIDNNFTGNTFASVACAGTSDCLTSSMWLGNHTGFAPYCFYQEPANGAAGGFFTQVTFIDTHCESVGNGFIVSHAQSNAVIDSVYIRNPGFSWDGGTGCGGSACKLTNSVSTTGTTQSTQIITSVATTTGIQVGMRVADGDGDLPTSDFVIAIGPGSACSTTLTSGQVCVTQAATGSHSSDSLTFKWDQLYAIDAGVGPISGVLDIAQGIAPVTAGSSGTIVYSNQSSGGTAQLDYTDGNHTPPYSSTDLVTAADDAINGNAFIRVAGVHDPIGVTVSSGQSSGSTSVAWQKYAAAQEIVSTYASGMICSPQGNAGSGIYLVSVVPSISGANLVVTVTLSGNATNTVAYDCTFAFTWR